MSNTRYVFEPKPEIADWIDENIPSWTSFCYESIYRRQKNDHYTNFNRIASKLSWILIGCILLSLTYILPNSINWLIFFITGVAFICFGFLDLLLWRLKNGKR